MNVKHKLACIAVIIMLIPSSSYAIIDVGVYGGYTFAGSIDNPDIDNADTAGWQYGFLGHINGSVIPMILSVGIGGFYQISPMQFTVGGKDFDITRTMYGIDTIAMLEIPILIHPYVRAGIAINEKVEIKTPLGTSSEEKKFNSYYVGLGAAFTVFPFVQVFGEYLYNYSRLDNDGTLKSNSINIGARLNI